MRILLPGSARAATLTAFAILFLGVVTWAVVTDLDYGVHAEGRVVNRNANVLIQHNATARVAKVLVVEGQHVRAGQTLIALDDSESLAEATRSESQRLTLKTELDALLAEQRESIVLPAPVPMLDVLPPHIVRQSYDEAVLALRQRISSHRSQLAQIAGEIRGAEAMIVNVRDEIARIDEQIEIVKKTIGGLEPMLQDRLIARNMVDEQRLRLAELSRMRAEKLAERERLGTMIEQARSRRSIYLADREKEMRSRLSELTPQVKAAEQQVAAVSTKLKSHVVLAPADGQVINVKVKAPGEVVSPGAVLMEVVPVQRTYYVEAKVAPAEIESVHSGMPAEIQFVTLPAKSTPYVDGRLAAIGSNSTVNEKTGDSYYIATVDFTGDVTKAIGMEPVLGMPVNVMLKGGRRSVMSYIVEPFRALMRKAMRET